MNIMTLGDWIELWMWVYVVYISQVYGLLMLWSPTVIASQNLNLNPSQNRGVNPSLNPSPNLNLNPSLNLTLKSTQMFASTQPQTLP